MKKIEEKDKEYWLTPPEIYKKLDEEFHFDFDPCPYPRPDEYNSLLPTIEWGDSNYINPPFRLKDTADGKGGPTAFARRAIEEFKNNGKESVLMLPVQSYVNLLLEAGAELRSMKRVRWVSGKTGEAWKGPTSIALFILKKKKKKSTDTA